jgi:opacity protein-like surface antigen
MVPMKRWISVSFCALLCSAALSLHAQVVPSATRGSFTLDAGAEGSMFQPDYTGIGIAYTGPQRLYGIGAYVDARFSRWVQIEGEGRWLRFNEYVPPGSTQGISEDTFLIGPRIPIGTFHKLTPYGKVLVGLGGGSFLDGHSFALAYGGGLDYRLSKHFTVRCVDFEYEQWPINSAVTLWPYGGSIGLSYRIMGAR